MSRLVDAQAVADHIGLKLSWVREQTRRKRIPHVPLGRYVRYDLDAIDEWWQSLAVESGARPVRRPRKEAA